MEARAISVNVFASRTSRNGDTFGSEEMTDDRTTPAEEESVLASSQTRHVGPAEASPSSSSTAPGEATNTGSEGKQNSPFHSMCVLATTSTFASCWDEKDEVMVLRPMVVTWAGRLGYTWTGCPSIPPIAQSGHCCRKLASVAIWLASSVVVTL